MAEFQRLKKVNGEIMGGKRAVGQKGRVLIDVGPGPGIGFAVLFSST
jgi:hypothetical protein